MTEKRVGTKMVHSGVQLEVLLALRLVAIDEELVKTYCARLIANFDLLGEAERKRNPSARERDLTRGFLKRVSTLYSWHGDTVHYIRADYTTYLAKKTSTKPVDLFEISLLTTSNIMSPQIFATGAVCVPRALVPTP